MPVVCRSRWGICIAYGVYAKKKDDVVLATTVQGFGDMSVAMLAAVAILPGLFSVLGEQGASMPVPPVTTVWRSSP